MTAVSYKNGQVISKDTLRTTGAVCAVRLTAEKTSIPADGHSLCYVSAELVDADGNVVPDGDVTLTANLSGNGELLGFGSANPVTAENYTCGKFTSFRGRVAAVIRSGYEPGQIRLDITADGADIVGASCTIETTI